jgi:predicted DNA-binding transcriptional regulator AlpA
MPKQTSRSDRELVDILAKVAGLLNTSPASVMQLLENAQFPAPEERMIKISQIAAWFGVSEAVIYKWVRDEQFPPPVNLGRADDPFATKRWYYKEVREWLHGRPRGTGKKNVRQQNAK